MITPFASAWSTPGEVDDDDARIAGDLADGVQPSTSDAVASTAHIAGASVTAHLRPPLPAAALHGLAGDIARFVSRETGGDPAAALAFTLTMAGNAVGTQPHVWFGGAEQSARNSVVVVGDSASRKDTVLAAVRNLFAQADPDWASGRVDCGLQSPEALIERVADGPNADCRVLVEESEYQRLVSRMTRSPNFGPILREAYDGKALQITRSKGGRSEDRSVRSSHPHISMIALITPEELGRIYLRLLAAGGLETRVTYFLCAQQGDTNPFAPASPDDDVLVDRLRTAVEWSRARVLGQTDPVSRSLCLMRGVQPHCAMDLSPGLRNQWSEIKDQLPVVKAAFRHLVSRAPTHVVRFALEYAILDMSPVLGVEHIEAALALWTFSARSVERIFGVPTGTLQPEVDPRRVGQLYEWLAREGGWVSRDHIASTLFRGNVDKAHIDAAVASLLEDKLIERRIVPTGGRPRTEFRFVERGSDVPS